MPTALWIKTLSNVSDITAVKAVLSASELGRLNDLTHPRRQKEFIASRLLLREALSHEFNQPLHYWEIEEREGNSPHVTNLSQGYFLSISHSAPFVVCSLSDSPHGVDIENRQKSRSFQTIADEYFSPFESSLLRENNHEAATFYQIWCAKEAWYKALYNHNHMTVQLFDLCYKALSNSIQWHEFSLPSPDYQLTLVSQDSQPEIELFHI